MRMTAPAIGGAAVVLAAALVWYFQPDPEPLPVSDGTALRAQEEPVADAAAARVAEMLAATTSSPPAAPVGETGVSSAPSVARSPLPGETPATPMANLLQIDLPPDMAEGEREFAAEPVDATWAPGAEADLLAKFAQMPGLKLLDLQVECRSTTCRLQLTQPSWAPPVEGGPGGPRPFNITLDSVGLEPRWMITNFDGSNAMKSVAYLWREGFAPRQEAGQPHEDEK